MTKPTCYTHREYDKPRTDCPTCRRIGIEQRIVKKTVDALLKHTAYQLQTSADESDTQPTRNRVSILARLGDTDDERLLCCERIAGGRFVVKGWVYFVYGNDGYDVISDYTVNLEPVLQPVLDYAETLEPR